MERIIPDVMKASLPSPEAAGVEKSKTTARAENTNEGFCPICGEQMRALVANGHSVLSCMDHAIVMPTRD